MSEATFVGIVAGWIAVGLAVAAVMTHAGHERFSWFVFSILLGPLALPFAAYEHRHNRKAAKSQEDHDGSQPSRPGPGASSAITSTTSSPMAPPQ